MRELKSLLRDQKQINLAKVWTKQSPTLTIKYFDIFDQEYDLKRSYFRAFGPIFTKKYYLKRSYLWSKKSYSQKYDQFFFGPSARYHYHPKNMTKKVIFSGLRPVYHYHPENMTKKDHIFGPSGRFLPKNHMTSSMYSVLPHGLAGREAARFFRGCEFVSDHVSGLSGWDIIYAKWISKAVCKKFIDFHQKFLVEQNIFRNTKIFFGAQKYFSDLKNFRSKIRKFSSGIFKNFDGKFQIFDRKIFRSEKYFCVPKNILFDQIFWWKSIIFLINRFRNSIDINNVASGMLKSGPEKIFSLNTTFVTHFLWFLHNTVKTESNFVLLHYSTSA